MREKRGRSPFSSINVSTVADSVASHLRYSLSSVSGFTGTAASKDIVRPGRSEESVFGNLMQVTQAMGDVVVESGEEDVLLADLPQKLNKTGSKKVDSFKL